MKRMSLLLLVLLLAATAPAQRKCDLEIFGGVLSTTIVVDPSGASPVYFDLSFRNNGVDTFQITDTMRLSSGFIDDGIILQLSPLTLPPGGVINMKDTFYYTSGPAEGVYRLCDSVWILSRGVDPAIDPDLTNNGQCREYTVVNRSTAISETFVRARGLRTGSLSLMPNPASNLVGFDFVAGNNTEVIAAVYDLSGRALLQHSFGKAYKGQSGYNLDISSLQPGVYFITLSQEGARFTGKLLKQ